MDDPRLTAIAIAWPMLAESTRNMLAGIVAANVPRGRLKKPKPQPDPDGTDRPGIII